MYCRYCGKENADTNAFCTQCGKPIQNELAYWVQSARDGNQEAVSALYEKTYSKVYYTVKSMIKDEDAVLDIVQDTYIKAFTHLDKFEGDDKFLPWVKQIAANTARDWLKKKRPTLFTEMTSEDEQDAPIEEQFADERGAYIENPITSSVNSFFMGKPETREQRRQREQEAYERNQAANDYYRYSYNAREYAGTQDGYKYQNMANDAFNRM